MASPQPEGDLRNHFHVIYLTFTHLISPFSPRWYPRTVRRHIPSNPGPLFYHSQASLSSPSSSVPEEGVPQKKEEFLGSPKKECPLRHGGSSGSRGQRLRTTVTFVNVYIPLASSCPRNYGPDFDALLVNRGD